MSIDWARTVTDAAAAMTGGEAAAARDCIVALAEARRSYEDPGPTTLSSLWEPFVRLLGRRGYFVSSPEALRNSLDEIRSMGTGFDLYDLAAALARCDALQAADLGVPGSRVFPELRVFGSAE